MQYRNVGDHAENTDGGQTVDVGGFVDLDEDQVREPLNEDLIARGVFLAVDDQAEHEQKLAGRRTKQRSAAADAESGEEE